MLADEISVPLVIYGIPFHNVTFEEALDWITERVRSGKPASVATANLDFLSHAWRDPELQRLLIDADLVLADGFPVVKLAPLFGPPLKERVTGSDITPMLAKRAAEEGFSIYGLGGEEGVAERAMHLLKKKNPGLKVAGSFSPSFASVLDMDHGRILSQLRLAKPDILFVALGAPKQDKFINMHVRNWDVPVAIGVGAALDFVTSVQTRAPNWMISLNLEWFWRVLAHPFRLIPRYLVDIRFMMKASVRIRHLLRMKNEDSVCQTLTMNEEERLNALNVSLRQFHPIPDAEGAALLVERMMTLAKKGSILMDVAAPYWLNSLELGALLKINKACRAEGYRLILYAPRPKVRKMLETCRLTDYFNLAYDMDQVERLIQHLTRRSGNATVNMGERLILELPIELNAATVHAFELQRERIFLEMDDNKEIKSIVVEAERLEFIDSSGLGALIALKKMLYERGISMTIHHLNPRIRKLMEVANIDKILLRI